MDSAPGCLGAFITLDGRSINGRLTCFWWMSTAGSLLLTYSSGKQDKITRSKSWHLTPERERRNDKPDRRGYFTPFHSSTVSTSSGVGKAAFTVGFLIWHRFDLTYQRLPDPAKTLYRLSRDFFECEPPASIGNFASPHHALLTTFLNLRSSKRRQQRLHVQYTLIIAPVYNPIRPWNSLLISWWVAVIDCNTF